MGWLLLPPFEYLLVALMFPVAFWLSMVFGFACFVAEVRDAQY